MTYHNGLDELLVFPNISEPMHKLDEKDAKKQPIDTDPTYQSLFNSCGFFQVTTSREEWDIGSGAR